MATFQGDKVVALVTEAGLMRQMGSGALVPGKRLQQICLRARSLVEEGDRLYDTIDYLAALKRYRQAMTITRQALKMETRKRAQKLWHRRRARILRNMGDCWYRLGNFDRAECCYYFALRSSRRSGASASALARVYKDLGDCRYSKEDVVSAEKFYRRCLQLARRAKHKLLLVVSLLDLADCFRRRGDFRGAQVRYAKALVTQEACAELDRKSVAIAARGDILEAVGECYFRLRDNARAKHCFEQALECKSRVFGSDDPCLRDLWLRLSHIHVAEQQSVLAVPHLERLVALLRKYDPSSLETARTKTRLAQCLAVQHRNIECAQLCEEAVQILEKHLEPASGELRQCLISQANAFCWLNQYVDAERVARRLLKEDSAAGLDLQTARAVHLLGVSLAGQQKYAEALPHHKTGFALFNRIKGPQDPETVSSAQHLRLTEAYLSKNPSDLKS
ncbi:MAG: tetratricopeptide repeat protein [Candidatus Obscuribacterales bacterium]|nr:tetratricopeptide repeat protein [Candidatus Obscuribacterales bacterium]